MLIVDFVVCLMPPVSYECSVFFNFSKLSKAFPDEGLDHFLPQSAELDPRFDPHPHLRTYSYAFFFFSAGAEVEFMNLAVFFWASCAKYFTHLRSRCWRARTLLCSHLC